MQSNLASKREYNFEQFEGPSHAPAIERLPKRERATPGAVQGPCSQRVFVG